MVNIRISSTLAEERLLNLSLTFLLLLLAQYKGLAQSVTVRGTIVDASTQEFVYPADVLIIETDQWTISDIDGNFRFHDMPHGTYTLDVRMLGYKPRSFQIDINTTTQDSLYKLEISPSNVELKSVIPFRNHIIL